MADQYKENQEEDQPTDRRQDMRAVYSHLDAINIFCGQARMAGVVALIIWAGSFVYTFNLKQDIAMETGRLRQDISHNVRQIGEIDGTLRVTEDRYLRLSVDIKRLGEQLEHMIEILSASSVKNNGWDAND